MVWLDPHHNLTDSEGYGTATKYYTPKSEYETLQDKIQQQTETIFRLEQDLQATDDLLNELNKSKPPV